MLVVTLAAWAASSASRRRRGGAGAQGGRDAGDVEPLRAGEDLRPIDHARLDGGDGGALAVVEDAAGPRGGAELQEVHADAVVLRPDDVLGRHAGLAAWLAISRPSGLSVSRDTHAAERPEPGEADGGVQFRAADLDVEAAGLLQAAEVRRG